MNSLQVALILQIAMFPARSVCHLGLPHLPVNGAYVLDLFNNSPESHLHSNSMHLMQHLKSHDYQTALIGKNHCFDSDVLATSIDHLRIADHCRVSEPRNADEVEMCRQRAQEMQAPLATETTPSSASITQWVADHCIDYLANVNEQAFCCWLSIPDPHPPYMVCEPYCSMYKDMDIPGPKWRDGEMHNKPRRQQIAVEIDRFSAQYPNEDDIIALRRTYWGMVSQVDDHVGRIMHALTEHNLLENTIVLFTSDHGDYMGDHRLIRKGVDCYAATTHVPMLWSWPGQIQAAQLPTRFSNVDIFPTLCDLIDIPIPDSVQGLSHAALLRGQSTNGREYIFSHHGKAGQPLQSIPDTEREKLVHDPQNNFLLSNDWYQGFCFNVRSETWAYTYTPGDQDELYNRIEDPDELYNLADQAAYTDTLAHMRAQVIEWLGSCIH